MYEPTNESTQQVLEAAATLVAAFGGHEKTPYFNAFAPHASFIFHTAPKRLASRAEYEAEWEAWESEGFQVLGCRSIEPHVDMIGDDVAIFTHRVETKLAGVDEVQRERESIVFHRESDGKWLAVHEHLSLDPNGLQ